MTSKTIYQNRSRANGRLPFFVSITLLAFMITACAHTGEQTTEQMALTLPETYSLYGETAPVPDRWWEGFGSDELSRLIEEAISANRTLAVAMARLEQSRALAVQAGADKLPDLDLKAGVSETRSSTGDQIVTDRSRSLSLASSWEIDFWGKISATQKAALQDMDASREDLYAAAITLSSEVTLRWLEIIAVKRQLTLYAEQFDTNRTILELIELRYRKGLANVLDVYQQRQALAEIEAGFPQLEAQLQTLYHDLAVLCGKPPRSELGLVADNFPELPIFPETGVPADLLAKRPDIRAAGFRLRAAGNNITAARARRLPTVTLSATAGFSSDSLGDLLERWITSLAANLTWSIFNADSVDAQVTQQEQIVKERLADYEQAVLEALREVEDSMIREVKQESYIEALDKQLAISRDGFREAVSRYRKGLSDYLPVLSALTSTQRLERSIVQAELERFNQRVKLHRALGGGWMEKEFE